MHRKTDYSDQKQYRQQKHQQNKNSPENKNQKKNNYMGVSSDKQAKSQTTKLEYY